MRVRFAYDGPAGEAFDVPDACAPRLVEPAPGAPQDEDALVARAMDEPVGSAPLHDLARDAGRVLLLVDDATRTTRAASLLPHVARALDAAGVPDARVDVLVAQGTHRPMTPDELARKLGAFHKRWRVHAHDHKDPDGLVRVGHTDGGMPVVLNRRVAEADVVVGLGHVGTHAIMGYSGGAKIVFPGVAGEESIAWTHWTASWHDGADLLGVASNPVRAQIEQAARMAGLDAVLNVAMDRDGHVRRAAFGDPVRAHRACAETSRALFAAPLEAPAPVVVTDSRPADRDLWQSAKGLYAAALAVAEGGVIVLASPSPEGVAAQHPGVAALVGLDVDDLRARVADGRVTNKVAAAVAVMLARIRARSDVHLVSPGIAPEEARAMGFTPFARVQDALDAALEKTGRDARVVVQRHGGGILPVVQGRNARVLDRATA